MQEKWFFRLERISKKFSILAFVFYRLNGAAAMELLERLERAVS